MNFTNKTIKKFIYHIITFDNTDDIFTKQLDEFNLFIKVNTMKKN